jgi:hypothetical protein
MSCSGPASWRLAEQRYALLRGFGACGLDFRIYLFIYFELETFI